MIKHKQKGLTTPQQRVTQPGMLPETVSPGLACTVSLGTGRQIALPPRFPPTGKDNDDLFSQIRNFSFVQFYSARNRLGSGSCLQHHEWQIPRGEHKIKQSTEEQSPGFPPCLQQLQIQTSWGRHPLLVFRDFLEFQAINMKLVTEAEHFKNEVLRSSYTEQYSTTRQENFQATKPLSGDPKCPKFIRRFANSWQTCFLFRAHFPGCSATQQYSNRFDFKQQKY